MQDVISHCLLGVLCLSGGVCQVLYGDELSNRLEGVYLGQRLPGRIPEVFAQEVISGSGYRLHGPVVFCPDLTEVCWAVIPPAIMSTSRMNDVWLDPQPLDLEGRVVQAPAYSSDGSRLFYQAVMSNGTGGVNIWQVDRTPDGWGSPASLGSLVNSDRLQSQPCVVANGNLYYTGTLEGSGLDRGIYRSRLVEGEYEQPELLGGGINSEYIDYCPWVAPDESYLLFASSRPRAEEPLYLHVSFRLADGSWSEPQSIHEAIGFENEARFPSLSPDGRFLFFISENIAYWVDIAPVLELNTDRK